MSQSAKPGRLDVSVVLPSYNEAEAMPSVIGDIRKALDGGRWTYEILVIDDSSSDGTPDIARNLGARVITRRVRGGAGASRKTGIINALGDIVVMLDADGTYTAADIPKMLEYFPDYDQVNGARTSEQGTMKLLRTPAKWAIRMLAIYLSRTHIPDLNTGLKAFKRNIMLNYLWVIPDGFSCVTTMTLAFLCNGFAVKYIPSEYHPRIGKSKFHPIKDSAAYFMTVIRVIMYFNPLRVFLPLSMVVLAAGIARGIFDHFYTDDHALRQATIIMLLASVMIFSIGLLADLIVARGRETAYLNLLSSGRTESD
ncbi:MAG TPA: glycosyltransferase family 2 protein [Candidatus Brocadiia bacterium]|nr:glycosyltransferase family 2 protein [Candidatus Brocadiia bacterium]